MQIEELQKQLNLNQLEFAQKLGISKRSYIYKLEGTQDWKLTELINLCKLTDEEIELKFGGDNYSVNIKKIFKGSNT